MKTHNRFEFVIEENKESFTGDTQEAVFQAITADSLGATPKTKAKLFFEAHGVTDAVPDVNDKEKFYDGFFEILQSNLVGTWKWYKDLANPEHWRYDPTKNDYVRRVGMGKGKRSPEGKAKLLENIAKSHEARRNNPELAKEIAAKAGRASAGKKHTITPEERERRKSLGKAMRDARLKKYAEMTEEEREENRRKHSEAMRLFHQRRREQGLEYKGAKADKQRTENNNEQQQ